MKTFEFVKASSLASASQLSQPDGQTRFIAGGTDLLTLMKSRIVEPERIVDIKMIPGLNNISFDENGLRIGALCTLDDIEHNEIVRNKYPLLAQSIAVSASPQLRNRGTIGGNLNQAPRCWYYRGDFKCWLKGGEMCYARDGENSNHVLFEGGPCHAVYPSDPAQALVALNSKIRIANSHGERTLALEKFYEKPHGNHRQMTILNPGDIVTDIKIPLPLTNSRGIYLKAMERRVWAFAMVSIAAQIAFSDEVVTQARLILGGVAPAPWRLTEVENLLLNQRIDETIIERASELSVNGAKPLAKNEYKIPLIKGMVKEAFITLQGKK